MKGRYTESVTYTYDTENNRYLVATTYQDSFFKVTPVARNINSKADAHQGGRGYHYQLCTAR